MSESSVLDGRTARRERNRQHALDGYIECITQGISEPTFEQIADRSGLSYRSLYRYFDSLDEVKEAATERTMMWLGPLIERSMGTSEAADPLRQRIDHLITCRLEMYETTAPTIRMAIANRESNAVFAREIEASRHTLRCRVNEVFAPELAEIHDGTRALRISSIAQNISFNALDFHLAESGHTPADIHGLLRVQLLAALTAPSVDI